MALTFRLFLETETETKRWEDCTDEEIKRFNEKLNLFYFQTLLVDYVLWQDKTCYLNLYKFFFHLKER